MTTTFNFRSIVFKRAYLIVKETGCSMSEALVEAWNRYREYRNRIVKDMVTRINNFDHWYSRCDDLGYYTRFSRIQEAIRNQLLTLPVFFIGAIISELSNKEYIKSFI